jgi:glycosyltransferase involved in cell wall biosynthesis
VLLTALVNAHREGRLLGAALRSVDRARRKASLDKADFEIVLVLDAPDKLTTEVAHQFSTVHTRILVVDHGDAGRARNAGVAAARGSVLANLDADDLWGVSWLQRGLEELCRFDGNVVLHAQIAQYFGGDTTSWQSPSMSDPEFRVASMLCSNPWTSLVMAPTAVFEEYRYRDTRTDHRFAYEDWSWNCDTVAAGLEHMTVPRTVHFVRRRAISLSRQSLRRAALPIPHSLSLERARQLDSARMARRGEMR